MLLRAAWPMSNIKNSVNILQWRPCNFEML